MYPEIQRRVDSGVMASGSMLQCAHSDIERDWIALLLFACAKGPAFVLSSQCIDLNFT